MGCDVTTIYTVLVQYITVLYVHVQVCTRIQVYVVPLFVCDMSWMYTMYSRIVDINKHSSTHRYTCIHLYIPVHSR